MTRTSPIAVSEIGRAAARSARRSEKSLVNDATALVAYRVAVAAAVGGSFSLLDASLEFVAAAVGGIAIGDSPCPP